MRELAKTLGECAGRPTLPCAREAAEKQLGRETEACLAHLEGAFLHDFQQDKANVGRLFRWRRRWEPCQALCGAHVVERIAKLAEDSAELRAVKWPPLGRRNMLLCGTPRRASARLNQERGPRHGGVGLRRALRHLPERRRALRSHGALVPPTAGAEVEDIAEKAARAPVACRLLGDCLDLCENGTQSKPPWRVLPINCGPHHSQKGSD
mmetsp:Transcript_44750/g.130289  ORF Transcript_44750/g.130289 Transcript_44750/m.130289 type:complete len:209 (-) Transcript_44750:1307-1933(-)